MHVNGKELISASFKPATIEGRINYKCVQASKSSYKNSGFKEFWFKLTGNLLFYFSLNSFGGIKGNEPVGVMVLENMTVTLDEEGIGLFAFIITYSGDNEKHVFSCFSSAQVQNWVVALRQANYEHLRIQVKILENKLESLGGKSIFSWNNSSIARTAPARPASSPVAPPRNTKSIGPKTHSFVSHTASLQNGSSSSASEDLIKW